MSPNFINYYGVGGLALVCAPQPGRQALWPNVASPLDRNDFLSGDWSARQSVAGRVSLQLASVGEASLAARYSKADADS